MLNIFFGENEDSVYNTDVYFDNSYESSWLVDDFAKRVIKTIDKSKVIGANAIDSPFLGVISPEKLSGGTKTLLLIKNCKDEIFNASTCGDNCAPFILELAENDDITINLEHLMGFGKGDFIIHVLNDDTIAHNMTELMKSAFKYV